MTPDYFREIRDVASNRWPTGSAKIAAVMPARLTPAPPAS